MLSGRAPPERRIFSAAKMKQAAAHPSAYVAELRQGDWRVVVPIRGKLSPCIAPRSFSNRRDAGAWLQSEAGMHTVSELRTASRAEAWRSIEGSRSA